ncbi:MAG TPA: glutaminyl-peptide cyclotransferase [Chitinophagaceae bacterium]|nr:glutaminyl-peptide cyclotransferase [Chitinophagaceae bacterium]
MAAAIFCLQACDSNPSSPATTPEPAAPEIPMLSYSVVAKHAHDVNSFTEGLLVHDGKIYESTGAPEEMPNTRSLFGELNLSTGKIAVKAEIDRKTYFGEGIAVLNGNFYQLTYKNKKGFLYDAVTFKRKGEFSFANDEGWGLTNDSSQLIMTDGTSFVTFRNPDNFSVVRTMQVTDNGSPVENLNEPEMINGYLYINVYTTNTILKINPEDGKVVGRLDITGLKQEANTKFPNSLETNGIAYDKATDKIYVTGKFWPTVFEITFPH